MSTSTATPRTAVRRWPARSRRGGGPRRVPWAWVLPALLAVVVVRYVAMAAGGWYAFTDWDGISRHANFVGLDNFQRVFEEPAARNALENTLVLAFAFVVTTNVLGLALALGLNRTLRTRNFLRAAFFVPVVMSSLAVSYIWQFIFDVNGPLNRLLGAVGLESAQRFWLGDPTWALWTIYVVLVWQTVGLSMVMYLAGLQGIPDELDEAAAVDGASLFRRFRKVTLPLLAPAITVSTTLSLIYGLAVFDQVIALTNGGPVDASETLATQVYKQTFVNSEFGYGAAMAVVLTVLIAIFAFAQLAILRARERRIG